MPVSFLIRSSFVPHPGFRLVFRLVPLPACLPRPGVLIVSSGFPLSSRPAFSFLVPPWRLVSRLVPCLPACLRPVFSSSRLIVSSSSRLFVSCLSFRRPSLLAYRPTLRPRSRLVSCGIRDCPTPRAHRRPPRVSHHGRDGNRDDETMRRTRRRLGEDRDMTRRRDERATIRCDEPARAHHLTEKKNKTPSPCLPHATAPLRPHLIPPPTRAA